MNWNEKLKPFARRIRWMRAWRGLGAGLLIGGVAAIAWSALDWAGILFATWGQLGILALACMAAGALAGAVWPLVPGDVARSLDHRAGLKDRVGTAMEHAADGTRFEDVQAEDAAASLQRVEPKSAYPMKFSPLHASSVASCMAAGALFFAANTTILMAPEQKKAKQEAAEAAARVERVAKPMAGAQRAGKPSDEERKLAGELQQFAREMEKARMAPAQQMQRANELAEKAEKLASQRVEQADQSMQTAQAKLAEMKLEEAGITQEMKQGLQLSQDQLDTLRQQMEQAGVQSSDQKGDNAGISEQDLKNLGMDPSSKDLMNLTEQERKALQESISKQLQDLEAKQAEGKQLTEGEKKLMEQLRKLSEQLKMSAEVQKAIQELMASKEYQELAKAMQEMREKMAEAGEQMQQGQPLTEEEMKQMEEQMKALQERMEQFAKDWNDPEKREQMLEAMKQAMEDLKNGNMSGECQACLGLMPGMGGAMGMPTPGGPSTGGAFQNTERINKLDKGEDIKATAQRTGVRGQRDQDRGKESYVEIKAPTLAGSRSSVPYSQVAPKAKQQAEQAIRKSKVPRKHEQRVRNYFDSLTGQSGGKGK